MSTTDRSRALTRCAAAVAGRATLAAALLVTLLAVAAVPGGCGSQPGGGSGGSASAHGVPRTLRVMVFNIEYGGTQVSFKKVAEAVKKAGPDVVGLEEAETNTGRLAKLAGYPYYNAGLQIVSRYPILEPSGAGGVYAFIEVQPGYVVAISNVHLPSDPYGPNWIRDGKSADQVIALEKRLRLPAIQQQVRVLPKVAAQGIPVFVTGDFNEPSHLDYTQAAVGTRPEVKYVVDWPVSQAMADAGFKDSYRVAHPDPVKDPGLTWWAARPKVPGWNPTAKDPQDRIDFVYTAGPSKVVKSEIVGEEGNPAASITVTPWPSDHRAVVSTFAVVPGRMPVMVATNKLLLRQGEPLVVTFHSPGQGGETVVITQPTDTRLATPPPALASQRAGTTGVTNGKVTFATAKLPGTQLSVELRAGNGKVLAHAPVWVARKGAKVQLILSHPSYKVGAPIVVNWRDAPANRWDWIGVYKKSAADPSTDYYLIWQYTGGAEAGSVHGMPAGTMILDGGAATQGSPWPLPPGKYVVYYLLADAYTAAAKASFTVTK
ncbi:MAG TPA: endonuclease/exonuclease/phosphatase family protein [Thermoleophilia bacterium]|nr:endonuclease/exonuclease/phosphatase family protein [Thermoleophilia bacterium]